jgi:hypothetical protein
MATFDKLEHSQHTTVEDLARLRRVEQAGYRDARRFGELAPARGGSPLLHWRAGAPDLAEQGLTLSAELPVLVAIALRQVRGKFDLGVSKRAANGIANCVGTELWGGTLHGPDILGHEVQAGFATAAGSSRELNHSFTLRGTLGSLHAAAAPSAHDAKPLDDIVYSEGR